MGAVRDYFDVVGGVRSGLSDDPPWWAAKKEQFLTANLRTPGETGTPEN